MLRGVIAIAQNESGITENPGNFCQIDLEVMHLAVCFEEAENEMLGFELWNDLRKRQPTMGLESVHYGLRGSIPMTNGYQVDFDWV
jgi:hypothetical protein